MAIYRCNKCGHLQEIPNTAIGTQYACPQCGQSNPAYDTVFFVKKLLERYFVLQTALKRRETEDQQRDETPPPPRELTLHATDQASDNQQGPIRDWFRQKNLSFESDQKAVDTSGFYDEVAVELGTHYAQYKPILDQLRFAYNKSHSGITLNLSKRSQKEAQQLTQFCRELYDYAFVSRYQYQKIEKIVRLGLQTAPQIRSFFSGEWLEWFALVQVLEAAQAHGKQISCARNLSVQFPNEDIHELDVFALLPGWGPLCIECKSGEFRPYIDKYATLKKRLGLQPSQFIICVAGLPDEQAMGLSSMYELSFVSQAGLGALLKRIMAA